jgi:hypothetical protein
MVSLFRATRRGHRFPAPTLSMIARSTLWMLLALCAASYFARAEQGLPSKPVLLALLICAYLFATVALWLSLRAFHFLFNRD